MTKWIYTNITIHPYEFVSPGIFNLIVSEHQREQDTHKAHFIIVLLVLRDAVWQQDSNKTLGVHVCRKGGGGGGGGGRDIKLYMYDVKTLITIYIT